MANPFQGDDARRAPGSQKGPFLPPPASPTAIGGKVAISINDQAFKVPLGTTILEAAREAGIRIPTLCHHPDLCVAGVCRICTVEVEGQRTLQAACAYPVTTPIKVHTHTQKVRQARRHVLDLMLSEQNGE
jgi:NADH-quinone oxidoreductase subunit G/[NiFe] hydrogenase diaphorase moiety small subunit